MYPNISRRKRFPQLSISLVLFLLFSLVPPGWAQSTSFGTITGTVNDPAGALVSSAKITIKSVETGLTRDLETDTNGNYNAPSLSPGHYIVTATKEGFSTQVGNELVLSADQVARVDFGLKIGGADQVITVDTSVSQLQTDNPSVGATIDSAKVVSLPLNGRNFIQLTQLIPGVNPGTVSSIAARRGRGSIGQSDANGGLTATQINGQRDTQNRYFIEGAESMDYDANTYSFSPSVDAIWEFKVETSSSTAENGGALGGFINVILKSGTNDFHGTLWEFNRNNYFTKSHDFISTTNPNPTAPRLNRNQFGGNIGGPVIIPHLYNGRGRTFFFVNEEEGRNLTASTPSFLTVPTLAQQGGDLSAVTGRVYAASGSTTTTNAIIDPTTGQPFANKQIPKNRISASALKLLSYTPPTGSYASGTNYQTGTPKALSTQRDIITRLDHQLAKHDQINGHFIWDDTFNAGTPLFGHDQDNNDARSTNLSAAHVHTFGYSAVNTASYGYHRFTEIETFGTTDDTNYNIANAIGVPFASSDSHFYGPPTVNISGPDGVFSLFQLRRTIGPRNRSNSAHTVNDSLSLQLGKHFLSGGVQLTFKNDTFDQIRDPRGTFGFTGQWTGSALADFLLGYMQAASINPTHTYTNIRTLWQGYFVQDNWHVRNGLTVSLGLRWDHMPPWVQNNDQYAAIATLPNGIAGSLLTPQTSQYGRGLIPPHFYDFAPRIGFNWQPFGSGKTVVRGGYGWYFTTDIANQPFTWAEGAQAQAGASISTSNQPTIGVTTTPSLTFSNPFPGVTLGGAATYPFANAVDPNLQDAYTQQWNLTTEQQFPAKLIATLGYVGAKSTHNYTYYPDVNMPVPVDPSTPGLASLASRRPNQTFKSGTSARSILGDFSNGSATYNSLQAKLERRVGRGLTVLGSYTWSHAISGPSDIGGYVGGGTFNPTGLNIYNPRSDRSAAIFDLRHRFVATAIWDVPFFAHTTGWKKAAFDGLQASTILVAQSGPAGSVFNSVDTTGTGLASRPDIIPGQSPNAPAGGRTNAQWFNTAAFRTAAAGTFGNAPRVGVVTLPGILNDDSSFVKAIKFGEQRNLQLRADIFNLFLRYNANPNAVGLSLNNTSTFGKLGGGTSDVVSRVIQLSAKLNF